MLVELELDVVPQGDYSLLALLWEHKHRFLKLSISHPHFIALGAGGVFMRILQERLMKFRSFFRARRNTRERLECQRPSPILCILDNPVSIRVAYISVVTNSFPWSKALVLLQFQ